MTGDFNGNISLRHRHCDEGFFSRRSNLTTIAISVRIKIASFLAMTAFLLESVDGSLSKGLLKVLKGVSKHSSRSVQAEFNVTNSIELQIRYSLL